MGREGSGGGRHHVVLAGGVADAGAVVHAWGLDVRRLHVVARRNMRANCKSLIQRRFPAADTVRPDTRSVRADAFPVVPRSCRSAPWARWLCRGAIAPIDRKSTRLNSSH